MSDLYLVPAAGPEAVQHLEDTIYSPVPAGVLEDYLDPSLVSVIAASSGSAAPIWGTRPNLQGTWETMDPGDWCLFYTEGHFPLFGRVVATFRDPDLAEHLWGSEDGETWECAYALDRIRSLEASKSAVLDALDYGEKFVPRGFIRVRTDLEGKFGSVEEMFVDLNATGLAINDLIDAAQDGDTEAILRRVGDVDDLDEGALAQAIADKTRSDAPGVTEAITKRVKRDLKLARDIKALYGGCCQVCGFTFTKMAGGTYAEAAHIKAISTMEKDVDTKDNIVVLCPNHHKMLDLGPLSIAYEPEEDRLVASGLGEPQILENKHIGPGRPAAGL